MSCKDCISGVKHEGEPTGTTEQIGGIECYVATPQGDYAKDKVILFLADAFGLSLVNNKLLADGFAANGFKTVIPDIFAGDPVPAEVLSRDASNPFDFSSWFVGHGDAQTLPIIEKVIEALKQDGITSIGATGYCFGGRYTFLLGIAGTTKVSVVAHPSLLKIPQDLESYAEKAEAPLLINACEIDQQFPREAQAQAEEIFGKSKLQADGKFKQIYWDGCTHGFAVRGDLSNPKVKAGNEGSFKATVEWFKSYL